MMTSLNAVCMYSICSVDITQELSIDLAPFELRPMAESWSIA